MYWLLKTNPLAHEPFENLAPDECRPKEKCHPSSICMKCGWYGVLLSYWWLSRAESPKCIPQRGSNQCPKCGTDSADYILNLMIKEQEKFSILIVVSLYDCVNSNMIIFLFSVLVTLYFLRFNVSRSWRGQWPLTSLKSLRISQENILSFITLHQTVVTKYNEVTNRTENKNKNLYLKNMMATLRGKSV